jgi:hypothetical protein
MRLKGGPIMRRAILSGLAGVIFAAASVGVAAAAPNANAIKECETAYKNGWTLTEEQVAQCQAIGAQSYSEPVTATNPGGNLPPGQQP